MSCPDEADMAQENLESEELLWRAYRQAQVAKFSGRTECLDCAAPLDAFRQLNNLPRCFECQEALERRTRKGR